jgi:hypothetical protein
MGSPLYGRLSLDGDLIAGSYGSGSLLWSAKGRCLAAQELVSWMDSPTTRVVVFDTERHTLIGASPARRGLATPLRFEPGALVYRRWNEQVGDQELRLTLADGYKRREGASR